LEELIVDLTNLQMNQTNDDRNDPTNDSIHGNQEYQQAIYPVVNDKFEFLVKAQLVSKLDNASKDTTGNVNQIDGSDTLIGKMTYTIDTRKLCLLKRHMIKSLICLYFIFMRNRYMRSA
jgi:hypothetical protein